VLDIGRAVRELVRDFGVSAPVFTLRRLFVDELTQAIPRHA
jgi:hypothetical protein